MKPNGEAINEWPARVAAWMAQIGVLEKK
jgi:hypothetical protein